MLLCHIIYDDNPEGSFIVDFAQGFVAFLTGGIPESYFDFGTLDGENFVEELDTDGCFEGLDEFPLDEAEGDVGLSGSGVT